MFNELKNDKERQKDSHTQRPHYVASLLLCSMKWEKWTTDTGDLYADIFAISNFSFSHLIPHNPEMYDEWLVLFFVSLSIRLRIPQHTKILINDVQWQRSSSIHSLVEWNRMNKQLIHVFDCVTHTQNTIAEMTEDLYDNLLSSGRRNDEKKRKREIGRRHGKRFMTDC